MPAQPDGSGPLIAVMNSSRDLVMLLQEALEGDGFRTIPHIDTIMSGASGPLAFLRDHQPAVAVYSISPPYAESWAIFQEVRWQWQGGRFVLTTTNLGALRAVSGPTDALELVGKPFDLDSITQALRRVLAAPHPADDRTTDSVGTAG
jgi:DNA-binding NtrC family response regulator